MRVYCIVYRLGLLYTQRIWNILERKRCDYKLLGDATVIIAATTTRRSHWRHLSVAEAVADQLLRAL